MLEAFCGTMLFTLHDRYLAERVEDRQIKL